jgi:hypothetical protein
MNILLPNLYIRSPADENFLECDMLSDSGKPKSEADPDGDEDEFDEDEYVTPHGSDEDTPHESLVDERESNSLVSKQFSADAAGKAAGDKELLAEAEAWLNEEAVEVHDTTCKT